MHDKPEQQQFQRQESFLYLTWFPTNNARPAKDFILGSDGTIWLRTDMYNWAVQGAIVHPHNKAALGTLSAMRVLVIGLSHLDDLPITRLLIVSHFEGAKWTTNYYDLGKLPASVLRMLQASKAAIASVGFVPPPPLPAVN